MRLKNGLKMQRRTAGKRINKILMRNKCDTGNLRRRIDSKIEGKKEKSTDKTAINCSLSDDSKNKKTSSQRGYIYKPESLCI